MGKSFPILAVPGNHDILNWFAPNGYKSLLLNQLRRSKLDKLCFGEIGINFACILDDVVIVMSGVGTLGSGHSAFVDSTFTKYRDVPFKICIWHKNQKLMQTGDKEVWNWLIVG